MSKQIQRNEEIYIAPGIIGKYENESPVAIDKKSGQKFNPTKIDDQIIIYEKEVKGWFLNPASKLLSRNSFDNGFIVLMICMSYFEGVEQYKTGIRSNGRSGKYFKDSVKRLYPNKFRDIELGKLYSKSRCGLFHNGMVKGGIVFSAGFSESIKFQNNGDRIEVNPKLLLEDIKEDFEKYINELKSTNNPNDETKRENFNKIFTVLEDER